MSAMWPTPPTGRGSLRPRRSGGLRGGGAGCGRISDPAIKYWEKLSLVTRGPLLDGRRLNEESWFNLGLNPPPQVQVEGSAAPEEGESPPPQP